MPMMRGIKFACEPCIRGHRSSKCNHSDRVLVQVRKPGRPLSSCPHTLSSSSPGTFVHSLPGGENGAGNSSEAGRMSCSCDVTSVAIPKIASCACGTPESHEPPPRPPSLSIVPPPLPQSPTINAPSPMVITSPISPTIISANSLTNGSANKVTKSQRSKKRDGPVRRGSVIVGEVALELLLGQERERSETGSLEIENTGNNCGEVTGIKNGNGSVNGNGMQRFTPTFSAIVENEGGTNGFQQISHVQNGSMLSGNSKQLAVTNEGLVAKSAIVVGVNGILSQDIWNSDTGESSSWQLPQITAKKSGCGGCNGKSPQPPQQQLQQQYMHHAPILANPPQRSGCCSNSKKTSPTQQPQQSIPVPQPPFSAPQFFPAPQYPPSYISTPNLPQVSNACMYSTINHPITHQEYVWLQQQRAAGLFGPQPAPQVSGHVSLPPLMVNNPTVINNPLGNSWGHSCHCGPSCNCLGCVTHPFNRRTVEHVREMQSFMTGDNGASSLHSHSRHNRNHSPTLAQQLSQPQPQPQQSGFEATSISLAPAGPTESSPGGFSCNGNGTPASASSASCYSNKSSQEEQQISPPPEQEDEVGTDGTPGGTEPGGELSPSGFIYFDYPLGMCAQTETGCKCGEGCTCVGCITHGGHDGVELEGNGEEHADWSAWGIEGGS